MARYQPLAKEDTFTDDEECSQTNGFDTTPKEPGERLSRLFTPTRIYIYTLNIIILALISLLWYRDRTAASAFAEQTWSPVQQHIEFEARGEYVKHKESSIYSGPPSMEQDRAWDELIKPSFFATNREELEKAGEWSERLAELEGGGYPATLGVYHEIHCVRQLRLYLFKETYYPNLTEAHEAYLHSHLDHCLEALRRIVMCHGNTALHSFEWEDPTAELPAAKSNAKLNCVKWSSIEEWSRSRMVPVHPPLVRIDSQV
ncbi:hypothetical protein Hte_009455 [Hypoxylon texense]